MEVVISKNFTVHTPKQPFVSRGHSDQTGNEAQGYVVKQLIS